MSDWADPLIEFWRDHRNFRFSVHPDDEPVFRQYDKHWATAPDRCAAPPDVNSDAFLGYTPEKFITSLSPAPYCGDLRKARALILLLNPGFHPGDHIAEASAPFRAALQATLDQDFSPEAGGYPMFVLDPRFAATPGYAWWAKKFEPLANSIAQEAKTSKTTAYQRIASRLATLELVPYHSRTLRIGRMERSLPSVQAVRQLVQRLLHSTSPNLPQVIITRSVGHWLTEQQKNVAHERGWKVYPPKLARSASLGPNSPGGSALLEICRSPN